MLMVFLSFPFLWAVSLAVTEMNPLSLADPLPGGFNDQIQSEYEAFYQYEFMASHFSKPSVGLLGFAKFFQESANEEIEHARKFVEFVNKRGNRVELQHIMLGVEDIPSTKGGVLEAIRQAIKIEHKVTDKIKRLHAKSSDVGDAHAQQFLDEFLEEQVSSVAKLTIMKSRLELDDSATFLLDQELRK